MIKTGRVYGNLLLHCRPVNKKARQRAIGIVSEITKFDAARCEQLLEECGWVINDVIQKCGGITDEGV